MDEECGGGGGGEPLRPYKRTECGCKDPLNVTTDTAIDDDENNYNDDATLVVGTTNNVMMGTEDDGDEEEEESSRFVQIPLPGLVLSGDATLTGITTTAVSSLASCRTGTKRCVPAFCAICLESYQAGTEIVWSSNQQCNHVFHKNCLEQWVMKLRQSEGPICPCCRRDFLIDPYDLILAAANGNNDPSGSSASEHATKGDSSTDNNHASISRRLVTAEDFVGIDRNATHDTLDAEDSEAEGEEPASAHRHDLDV